ncbi:MAG TPA: 30S ribosomal protein S2 [Candidatus Polarisedimenticolia bacterium]|nr:30S ribosomal protein S2 [Candidatus Polarisedimenticolia bacterium]
MEAVSVKELLEAGVHFGHQTKRWNPKMREYIFGQRDGIYIINLQKTAALFRDALDFVERVSSEGRTILFVGTKRQAQEVVAEEAQRAGVAFVNTRWLGGTLTNFRTIKKRIERMRWLDNFLANPVEGRFTKKELLGLGKELVKLQKVLSGIRALDRLPEALFVIDPKKEHIAVQEARKLGIPVVAVVDTNCDPDDIDFPIPGNDDAIRAIKLFTGKVADAVLQGRNAWEKRAADKQSDEGAMAAAGGAGGGMPSGGDEPGRVAPRRAAGAGSPRPVVPKRKREGDDNGPVVEIQAAPGDAVPVAGATSDVIASGE